jgi:hypothetical protein
VQKEVYMSVDQSRHKRAVTKIDYLCACGMVNAAANFLDLVADDQNFAGHDHVTSFNLQQASSMKDNRARRWRSLRASETGERHENDAGSRNVHIR